MVWTRTRTKAKAQQQEDSDSDVPIQTRKRKKGKSTVSESDSESTDHYLEDNSRVEQVKDKDEEEGFSTPKTSYISTVNTVLRIFTYCRIGNICS